jgi:dethiobiotin synthetase
MSTPSRPSRGYFVTGTDTGVGKTLVTAGMLRLLDGSGRPTLGLKPVASGARRTPFGLRNEDAETLSAASSLQVPYELTNPCCFEPAIAPHLAARQAGVNIAVDELVRWYRRASAGAEIVLVEGAGGWRVPLHPEGFLSALPEQLDLGVILVVGLRLGCLNHARLSFEAIRATRRCRFVGWVGNAIEPGFEPAAANIESLEQLLDGPALALLPSLETPTPSEVARRLSGQRLAGLLLATHPMPDTRTRKYS